MSVSPPRISRAILQLGVFRLLVGSFLTRAATPEFGLTLMIRFSPSQSAFRSTFSIFLRITVRTSLKRLSVLVVSVTKKQFGALKNGKTPIGGTGERQEDDSDSTSGGDDG
jgi:hypothetical protein